MLNEVPDEIIGEIGGWLPVRDMARWSSTSRRIRQCTTHVLFRTVCLCPRPGTEEGVPPEHPSPLPEEESVKIKTLILDTTGAPLCQFNVERVLKSILSFRNIECLIVICGLFASCGVDTVLDRIGDLPTNQFRNLRYLEVVNIWPTRLQHHTEDIDHLCIRDMPTRRDQNTREFLANDYRNLTMLTLDGQSLMGLLRWEDGRRLCGGVKNMRILWHQCHLMDWGWNIEMKMGMVRLPGVQHLHLDVGREPFWGDVGDVKVALRNMIQICGEIGGTQLRELVIFVPEESLHNEDDYFELARCLPRTFRSQASLDQLRGVAVFFEVRDGTAVDEFRHGLEGDTELSLRVLERDPNDVTWNCITKDINKRPKRTTRTTPIVVMEGEAFKCCCKGRKMMQRGYVNDFLEKASWDEDP